MHPVANPVGARACQQKYRITLGQILLLEDAKDINRRGLKHYLIGLKELATR